MSLERSVLVIILTLLSLAISCANGSQPAPPPAPELAPLAEDLVRIYHAGDVESLGPHLSEEFEFRDPGLRQRMDLAGFLEVVKTIKGGKQDRELEIRWTGVVGDHADVRGTWRETDAESGRRDELPFSIELVFDRSGERPRVVTWLDEFGRRGAWKPIQGDALVETENFRVVYLHGELSDEEAARLGATLETWYEKTGAYLGRAFDPGYRLDVNVAGCHVSPYASDPGPEAFILVPSRSARREYGFSLVHELTHNLVGLSWLSRNEDERNGVRLVSGNRLFDEGFAVYVEEKLTGEGPRVWPNFGEETHAAYRQLRAERGEPIWPVLEAEIHREHGDTRLGYLAQASFCKFLVDRQGLEAFLRLYAGDPAAAREIYGKGFAELENEWRQFLEGPPGAS